MHAPIPKDGWHNPNPRPLTLSEWIEQKVWLPQGLSAEPGPMRLWPYQREMADTIGATDPERVTILKGVRVGYTALLGCAIAYWTEADPSPLLMLCPCEADARNFVVSDLEPLIEGSPAISHLLPPPSRSPKERNRLLHRIFRPHPNAPPTGSLKVFSMRSPRNLRAHTAKRLIADEVDALEATKKSGSEGDVLLLGERRTLSFPNRKIVIGSTPVFADTSAVLRLYGESDQRVYEVPCPKCGTFSEIRWSDIEWPAGKPDQAAWRCPSCENLIPERNKPEMVYEGRWRVLRPEVTNHAGFKINCLVSLLPGAAWGQLAAEFLRAKDDPARLQPFVNTILAEGWRSDADGDLDESELQARAEPFSLAQIPPEVISTTVGIDVQHDRLECTFLGWTKTSDILILEHRILHGFPNEDADLWTDLDDLLSTRFRHPHGGRLKVDACVIDCADGATAAKVHAFCTPRTSRKILAARGVAGLQKLPLELSSSRKVRAGKRLWLVGVDALKTQLYAKLARGRTIRFSHTLSDEFYAQLCSERRVVRYARGRPVARFERKLGARAEALDCCVYGMAARSALNIDVSMREIDLSTCIPIDKAPPPVIRSGFVEKGRF